MAVSYTHGRGQRAPRGHRVQRPAVLAVAGPGTLAQLHQERASALLSSPQGWRVGDGPAPGVLPVLLTQGGKRTVAWRGADTVAAISACGPGALHWPGPGWEWQSPDCQLEAVLCYGKGYSGARWLKGQDKKVRSGSQSFSNTR